MQAKYGFIVATGARPRIPEIEGLDSVPFLTYEEVFDLRTLPPRLTVLGGGPIGCELAQAFARLGSQVTLVAPGLLPQEEPEVGQSLRRVFESEGIALVQGLAVRAAGGGDAGGHVVTCDLGSGGETQVSGDTLLVAVGRVPVVSGLNLEAAGVEASAGGIVVDKKLKTSAKNIYAAGDCTGGAQYTHYAGFQGAIAARNLVLPLSDPGMVAGVPGCTFTSPEVGRVGLTEAEAIASLGPKVVAVALRPLEQVDRAICEGHTEGFLKIVYHTKNQRILGATITAPVAGEIISELNVAMTAGVKLPELASVVHAYPSFSIAVQQMAAEVYYDELLKKKGLYAALKSIGL